MTEKVAGGVIVDYKPLPEMDIQLLKEVNSVFEKFGFEGKLRLLEFECGTPPPKQPIRNCVRICRPGPVDQPICIWVCE